MSKKTPRHLRSRTSAAAKPTSIAHAVTTLPGTPATTPALTLVDSTSPAVAVAVVASGTSTPHGKQPTSVSRVARTFDPAKEKATVAELAEIMRTMVVKLNSETDIERGGMYHTLPGAMEARLKPLGFQNYPTLLHLMQELGVLRYRGAGKAIFWQVVCSTFFDELVTVDWLDQAEVRFVKHFEQTKQLRLAREQTEQLRLARERIAKLEESTNTAPTDQPASVGEADEALMAQIAGMVQDLDNLRGQLALKDEAIVALNERLAKTPKVTHADVASYLASLRKNSA